MTSVLRTAISIVGAASGVTADMMEGGGYDEPCVTAKATAGQPGTRRYFMAYRPKEAPDDTFAAFEVYATDSLSRLVDHQRARRCNAARGVRERQPGASLGRRDLEIFSST